MLGETDCGHAGVTCNAYPASVRYQEDEGASVRATAECSRRWRSKKTGLT